MAEKSSHMTIQRVFNILEVLARYPEGLPMKAILEEIGNPPKSSIFVVLQQLVKHRIVTYREEERRYKIGPAMINLSAVIMNEHTVQKSARFGLERLSRLTGEDTYLGVLDGNRLVYIDKVDGKESVRLNIRVGAKRYLHCTSIGKLLLAHLPREEQLRIIEEEGLPAFTARTITDPERLFEELENIRKTGYSINDEESMEGIMGIAAPIRDNRQQVVAGITIFAPVRRAKENRERYIQLVKETADEISRQLGSE